VLKKPQDFHDTSCHYGYSVCASPRLYIGLLLSRRCHFLVSSLSGCLGTLLSSVPRSALLFAALAAQAEIPALFAQRPIVLRQSRAAMYYPFIDALAYTLVDMPISFVTLVFFSIALYFIVGLVQTAGQFLCVFFIFHSYSLWD
jgi:ABC-type multidrug transport system permease subunit